ncbi:ABC transporter ATP-binding protein [Anaeromyxobacter oryzae]|uniref:ABC transporter ATP-binding protein n=1 Tax=Anaeromyxobacter oryzae TaxID=2918170 RepID=A0ABM7X0W5_9BACT|nr:ABC transporter ATP-binding protein [Anaeromyxobacter oryzae]BDG05428.1 ABC transporter ATP-binding protein [Anaeromyxobacter oryzae]
MLALDAVHKRYGRTVALDGLSLSVAPGEILGLLGPNGAGKTTAVHLAVGLLAPDAGRVTVEGRDPRDPAVRRAIGLAPQALAIYEALTAEENLRFFGEMYGLSGPALGAAVDAALALAALGDRRRDRAATFSGGMKRRLNLAAALVHGPRLLLLDEPTVGVDPQSRNAILERIAELRRSGLTVVYTTHYMEEAARLCDRVAILDRGRVLALGTVPELLRTHGGDPVLVARTGGETLRIPTRDPAGELARLAAARPIEDFHVERADLEAVFLSLTGRRLRDV